MIPLPSKTAAAMSVMSPQPPMTSRLHLELGHPCTNGRLVVVSRQSRGVIRLYRNICMDALLSWLVPSRPSPPAAKPERRARWQLPAVNPPAATPQHEQQQQQQQQSQQPAASPAAIQPTSQALQHLQQWRQQQQQPQQQQQHQQQHDGPAPTRSKSCRQGNEQGLMQPMETQPGLYQASSSAAGWGPHGPYPQPQTRDGASQQQYQHSDAARAALAAQQQQQSVSHSFVSELKRQLEHWASWVHMHSNNPQQVPPPPQLPPQLQAMQASMAQQQQYQQMAQQQYMQQQQQYVQQYPAGHQGGMGLAAAPPPGSLGVFTGPVPAHGALSRFTDPWAEKQQQRLMQHRQSTQDTTAGQQVQGFSEPPPWQQQGQASELEQIAQPGAVASPPPAVSASALMQQRRALQQQAFEGLSLEAVLGSAKKSKPPSRKQLAEGGQL